jgi:hypothetical protein
LAEQGKLLRLMTNIILMYYYLYLFVLENYYGLKLGKLNY